MERRHQIRIPVDILTTISYPPLGLLHARIRNFSQSGIFVQLDAVRVNVNDTVEIVSEAPSNARTIPPVQAIVVRNSHAGAGLSFLEPCPRFLDTLSTL